MVTIRPDRVGPAKSPAGGEAAQRDLHRSTARQLRNIYRDIITTGRITLHGNLLQLDHKRWKYAQTRTLLQQNSFGNMEHLSSGSFLQRRAAAGVCPG